MKNLEVFDDAGREARISCSNVRVLVLDLACLCHCEQLQAFCADCLIWRTAPAALSLTLGENLNESSSEPPVLRIPDGVLDSIVLLFAKRPDSRAGTRPTASNPRCFTRRNRRRPKPRRSKNPRPQKGRPAAAACSKSPMNWNESLRES